MNTIISIPIFLPEEEKCIIQEGIRYCEEKSTSLGEFGILLLVLALWVVGLFAAMNFTDKRFDNPFIGVFGYLILTALLLILLG
jgi:hypothetical protein